MYNEAVVHLSILSGLIRSTAINASRAQRSQVPMYKHFFEERNQCLQNIFKQHKELTSFEAFAATIYKPNLQQFTGNSFFNNSVLHQQQTSPDLNDNQQQRQQNLSGNKLMNSSKLNKQHSQEAIKRKSIVSDKLFSEQHRQPIIRNEHLERPNLKLMHQHSEPMLRVGSGAGNQSRVTTSASTIKSTNHHDILHLKHHPMLEK